MAKKRLIVGISGASGIIYGIRLLEILREIGVESHLVISKAAELTRKYESDLSMDELRGLADVVYPLGDVGAAISSGSFRTLGMIVMPCSIRTLSEIAAGTTGNLLTRAADVVLKERRRLVLFVRETPLHLGHLRSMTAATEAGAIIAPPVPAFYNRPATLADIVNHTVGRVPWIRAKSNAGAKTIYQQLKKTVIVKKYKRRFRRNETFKKFARILGRAQRNRRSSGNRTRSRTRSGNRGDLAPLL